ncbi:MAG: hypothetical protein HY738_05030 [Bacteroidia bacterium]|nr:hypothetical protein [Bacteroidia bacterium]
MKNQRYFKKILLNNIYGYIIDDINKFKKIKKKYRNCINNKNKLWVYLIELAICELDNDKAKKIISKHLNDEDGFVKNVAKNMHKIL